MKDNEGSLNQSVKSRDQLDEQLSAVNDDYKEKCSNVKQKESEKTSAQQKVSSAKTEVAQAQTGVAMAEQKLASAEATLSSTPQTLPNGAPNPAYASAKAAVEAAKAEKEQAENTLKSAEESLQSAENDLTAAENSLSEAQEAKAQTLQTLQETDSQYKDMAKRCEQMQKQVETSQKNYDTSLQAFDDTSANYERLNTELQSQQGVINQLEVCEAQVKSLQEASAKVEALEGQVKEKVETANTQEQAKFDNVKNDMLTNANKYEGCGADKTILENLMSAKDYDLSKCTGAVWGTHLNTTYGSAAEFEAKGYIKNSDGSFTDPRSGVTMINVLGDDHTWVSQEFLSAKSEVNEYGSKASAGLQYPGLFDAIERNQQQMDARVSFNGFDESGNPIIEKSKTRLDLGNGNDAYL